MEKIALVHASMVVTCYIKLSHTGSDRRNGILVSLFLLAPETKSEETFVVVCLM